MRCMSYNEINNKRENKTSSTITPEASTNSKGEASVEIKKDELDKVTFRADTLKKYFPRSYTNRQMEEKTIQLLEQWVKKRERNAER